MTPPPRSERRNGRFRVLTLVLLLGGAGAAWTTSDAAEPAQPARRPNILLITADNLGYGDLGCYGNGSVKTPHLDRLATQGVRCTDFYVAAPECSESRASLLTGRYPRRNGLTRQLGGDDNLGLGLRQGELLIPLFLKARGYATACFGKWNIGFAPGTRPTERGFDEFLGHASGNIDYYTHLYRTRHDLYRGTEPARVAGYSTDLFADAAGEFFGRHRADPFFVYLAFNAPHYPNPLSKPPGEPAIWQAPESAFAAYGDRGDEPDPRKRYRAVVTALDAAVGRVLTKLDELALADQTLVIFFSDNGAFLMPGKGLGVASNDPLRSGGATLYEGGIRTPCLVRWPGRIPPGSVCREPLIHMDFFAMALRTAGAAPPEDRVIDGLDPTPTLEGRAPSPHPALFFQYRAMSAVRQGRFKLLQEDGDRPPRLYDLADDLGETNDLATERPEVVATLRQEFDRWSREANR